MRSALSLSPEYKSFRGNVALRRLSVDADNPDKMWNMYDCGPRDQTCPVVFLPPISGTADVYFLQCLALCGKNFRAISVDYPPYWNLEDWCDAFRRLLDELQVEKVHLYGTGLGGYLAQKFAEFTHSCPRVASLILSNTFMSTNVFKYSEQASVFWMYPNTMLKSMVMGGLNGKSPDPDIARGADFLGERLETLSQNEMASRLTLNCSPSGIMSEKVNYLHVTIINVWDECAISEAVKSALFKCYPNARIAHLKEGGNFPFLSRSDEVNLHIMIHLRNFESGI